jgi:hypothetical protein
VSFVVILAAGVLLLLLLVFWDKIFRRLSRLEKPKISPSSRTIIRRSPTPKTTNQTINSWLFAFVLLFGIIVSVFVSTTLGAAIIMLYPFIQRARSFEKMVE